MKDRVVVYDGAMGTNIQVRQPTLDDYWGKENCSEVLVLSRPDIIRDIHADFFRVGCDVVETNTFGGTRTVLGEFDLPTACAKSTSPPPNWPGKSPSNFPLKISRASWPDPWARRPSCPRSATSRFDAMVAAYEEQAAALIEGGVDILLIETCAGSAAGEDRDRRRDRGHAQSGQALAGHRSSHAAGKRHHAARHRNRRRAHRARTL